MRDTPGNENKKAEDIKNIIKYGSKLPPEYNLMAIGEANVPIHVFAADSDQWSNIWDTEYLYRQISEVRNITLSDLQNRYNKSPFER